MKTLIFILFSSLLVVPQTSIEWKDIGKGVQWAQVNDTIFDVPQCISILRYKSTRRCTEVANDPGAAADSTAALIRRHGGIAGINASYFNMRTFEPMTYVKDDGVQEGTTSEEEAFRADGFVAIRANGHKVDIFNAGENRIGRYREAICSGPVLVTGGREARDGAWPDDGFFMDRHPRTIIGTTRDGWVYMIVIDGRAKESAAGVTIHEAAQIALSFGLKQAINLDGGGSSVLWTEAAGVLSHPCDNHRFDHYGQRKVPNVIYIR